MTTAFSIIVWIGYVRCRVLRKDLNRPAATRRRLILCNIFFAWKMQVRDIQHTLKLETAAAQKVVSTASYIHARQVCQIPRSIGWPWAGLTQPRLLLPI